MATIAISGKGGSGKTTIAAMIVRYLAGKGKSVLAVDADANCCLGQMLGVEPEITIAQLREEVKESQPTTTGMDKVRAFEYGIARAVIESKGFDLLTMGRPEGPGCYCAVNNLLRSFLDRLSNSYDFVVIDNEAGMEHLSRRTTNNVELLCIVAESTALGQITARRIFELAEQLPISVKEIGAIWNKIGFGKQEMADSNSGRRVKGGKLHPEPYTLYPIETFGSVPYDEAVFQASMQGKAIFDIEQDSPALSALCKTLEGWLGKLKTRR